MTRVKFNNASHQYRPIGYLNNPEPPFQSKPHISTWFITLNSNKASSQDLDSDRIGYHLTDILKKTFSEDNLPKYLEFNKNYFGEDRYQITDKMIADRNLFPEIELNYIQEEGSRLKRVHLHAEFKIVHYSNIQINSKKLQEIVSDQLDNTPFDSVYLNLKYIKSALPMINYMFKDPKYSKKLKKLSKPGFIDREEEYDEIASLLKDFNI